MESSGKMAVGLLLLFAACTPGSEPPPANAPAPASPAAQAQPAPAQPPGDAVAIETRMAVPSGNARNVRLTLPYEIQFFATQSREDALRIATGAKKEGWLPRVVQADLGAKGNWYRVRLGRFGTEAAAKTMLPRVCSSGPGRADLKLVPSCAPFVAQAEGLTAAEIAALPAIADTAPEESALVLGDGPGPFAVIAVPGATKLITLLRAGNGLTPRVLPLDFSRCEPCASLGGPGALTALTVASGVDAVGTGISQLVVAATIDNSAHVMLAYALPHAAEPVPATPLVAWLASVDDPARPRVAEWSGMGVLAPGTGVVTLRTAHRLMNGANVCDVWGAEESYVYSGGRLTALVTGDLFAHSAFQADVHRRETREIYMGAADRAHDGALRLAARGALELAATRDGWPFSAGPAPDTLDVTAPQNGDGIMGEGTAVSGFLARASQTRADAILLEWLLALGERRPEWREKLLAATQAAARRVVDAAALHQTPDCATFTLVENAPAGELTDIERRFIERTSHLLVPDALPSGFFAPFARAVPAQGATAPVRERWLGLLRTASPRAYNLQQLAFGAPLDGR